MKYRAELTIVLKGACMGVADVIPGVSGGTLALILGIYQQFIDAVKSISGLMSQFSTTPRRHCLPTCGKLDARGSWPFASSGVRRFYRGRTRFPRTWATTLKSPSSVWPSSQAPVDAHNPIKMTKAAGTPAHR